MKYTIGYPKETSLLDQLSEGREVLDISELDLVGFSGYLSHLIDEEGAICGTILYLPSVENKYLFSVLEADS